MRKSKQYESHKHHQNIYISRKNRSPTKIKTFITLKDHKDNHSNKPSCCLINLTKNELGKTSTKFPTHVKKVGQNSEFLFGIYRWTLKNPKNQNFEKKMKKNCWKYHHLLHAYQKPQSYEVQFLRYGVRQIFLVILDPFLPFNPPPPLKNPENLNFEKMKKSIWRYHHFELVQQKTIKWCMLTQMWSATGIIFVILGHFLLFYPTIDPENKKNKKTANIFPLHMCTINQDHMMYGFWDIKCKVFCYFGPYFALWPS